jgi:hypothetical protein
MGKTIDNERDTKEPQGQAMTDGNRRKLLILAAARASATNASAVVQRLLIDLKELKLERATVAVDEMIVRLMEIREYLTKQIGEVPS